MSPRMIIAEIIDLFDPNQYRPRTRSPRRVCADHLRSIGMSLLHYASAHDGKLPPAYISDTGGKPMHSWRALILNSLDRPDLARTYKLDELWNGPNNQQLWEDGNSLATYFHCPVDPVASQANAYCSYLVVTGPGTLFPGDKQANLSDIKDGPENTILAVEVVNSGIRWFEPRDLSLAEAVTGLNQGTFSNHGSGVNVVFADGHVQMLSRNIDRDTLKALFTIDGGEAVSAHDLP